MKICQWNIENLYLLMDKYSGEDLSKISNKQWQELSIGNITPNKHIQKIEDAAKVIKEINADIYLLCEVGGRDSLENFNKYFLDEKYDVIISDGTARRGLDVGFLINKNLEKEVICVENKKIKLKDKTYFSRTLGEIHIKNNNDLELVILLAHLKSMHRSENDHQGIGKRTSEVKGLNSHIDKINKNYNNPNILLAGDMNSNLEDLKVMGLIDLDNFLDLKGLSTEEKCTHLHFSTNTLFHQFDYIFSTKNMRNKLDLKNSYIYRFKNDYGDCLGLAESIKEKMANPSDHYPVVLTLK